MFEGITTAQWLGFMTVGAVGGGLVGLISRRPAALLALALWLAAPGLVFAAISDIPGPGEFLVLFVLLMLVGGIPWVLASAPPFVLVRLLARSRRRRAARNEVG